MKGHPTPDESGEAPLEKAMQEVQATRRGDERLPAYQRCPVCPKCCSACGIGHTQHGMGAKVILCASCGHDWIGTPTEIEQARKADESWERRQDDRKGPRAAVVRRRRRRPRPTDQLGLFEKKEIP